METYGLARGDDAHGDVGQPRPHINKRHAEVEEGVVAPRRLVALLTRATGCTDCGGVLSTTTACEIASVRAGRRGPLNAR